MAVSRSSLRFQLLVFFLVTTIPLVGLLIYQNWYAIQVVHNQVAESEKRILELTLDRIDGGLRDIDQDLVSLVASDSDLLAVAQGVLGDQYQLSKVQVSRRLTEDANLYPFLGAFFVFSPATGEGLFASPSFGPGPSIGDKDAVTDFLRTQAPGPGWFLTRVGGKDRLFRVFRLDTTLLGAWIEVPRLLESWAEGHPGPEARAFFLDTEGTTYPALPPGLAAGVDLRPGRPYTLSGSPVRYLVIGADSEAGPFRLAALIPDETILQSLPALKTLNALVAAAVVLQLLGYFVYLRRRLLRPLDLLARALERLREGDFEARIVAAPAGREFESVHATFNSMVTRIHDLKIDVYEERLHAHQAELQFLRLQINPHFFLNSLNILYQLAEVGNLPLIQELSLSLSRYFQFVFREQADLVPLTDEWEHVKTYLRIQELRFPGTLSVSLEAPTPLPDLRIPPLLLQTFIENSVQHAREENRPLTVSLTLEKGSDQTILRVMDNGRGFPAEIPEDRRHIGITNARRRLNLLFGDGAALVLSNRTDGVTGAVVEIRLPAGT